jgi:hypothetical protein
MCWENSREKEGKGARYNEKENLDGKPREDL